jgi:hypothetical protein
MPGQKFVPARGGPVGGDLGDDIGDVGLRIDAVGLAGLDDGVDRGGTLAAGLRSCEQPILPADGNAGLPAMIGPVARLADPYF